MKIGYIRVSDKRQNPDRQIEKMLAIGIEERFIFVDRQSGKDFARPAYQSMKQVLREGDLLYLDDWGVTTMGSLMNGKSSHAALASILSCWSRNPCLTADASAKWVSSGS